jgi:hypothetical protein
MWSLVLAAAAGLASAATPVHYKAVTETEYAIDLALGAKGQGLLEFDWWEADNSSPPSHEELVGSWFQQGPLISIRFGSRGSVTYKLVPCLSYEEFDKKGCSPGLRLVGTDLPSKYGLQRFGLWDSRFLRVEP